MKRLHYTMIALMTTLSLLSLQNSHGDKTEVGGPTKRHDYHSNFIRITTGSWHPTNQKSLTTNVEIMYDKFYYVADISYTIQDTEQESRGNGDVGAKTYKERKLVNPADFKMLYDYLVTNISENVPEDAVAFGGPKQVRIQYNEGRRNVDITRCTVTLDKKYDEIVEILLRNNIDINLVGTEGIFNLNEQ